MVSSHVRLDRTEVIGLRMKDIQVGGTGGGGDSTRPTGVLRDTPSRPGVALINAKTRKCVRCSLRAEPRERVMAMPRNVMGECEKKVLTRRSPL